MNEFSPYRRLAINVLLKAISDAVKGESIEIRLEAWRWINDKDASDLWVKAAGLDEIWPPSQALINNARKAAEYDKSLQMFFFGNAGQTRKSAR